MRCYKQSTFTSNNSTNVAERLVPGKTCSPPGRFFCFSFAFLYGLILNLKMWARHVFGFRGVRSSISLQMCAFLSRLERTNITPKLDHHFTPESNCLSSIRDISLSSCLLSLMWPDLLILLIIISPFLRFRMPDLIKRFFIHSRSYQWKCNNIIRPSALITLWYV